MRQVPQFWKRKRTKNNNGHLDMPLAICLVKRSHFQWERWHSTLKSAHKIIQIENIQTHLKTVAFDMVLKVNSRERGHGKMEMRYAQ